MKELWSMIQFVFTACVGMLGYFLGGCDDFIALLFVVIDYVTGIICGGSR